MTAVSNYFVNMSKDMQFAYNENDEMRKILAISNIASRVLSALLLVGVMASTYHFILNPTPSIPLKLIVIGPRLLGMAAFFDAIVAGNNFGELMRGEGSRDLYRNTLIMKYL